MVAQQRVFWHIAVAVREVGMFGFSQMEACRCRKEVKRRANRYSESNGAALALKRKITKLPYL